MKRVKYVLILCLPLMAFSLPAGVSSQGQDSFCGERNSTTQAGELVKYNVYYALAGIYVNAGTASFSNNLETLNGKPVYHIKAEGVTHPSYDWIYKVRDLYETFMDTATLKPMKFIRNVREGDFKHYENITFNHNVGTAITNSGVYKVPPCIQDVLSAVYNARNLDFNGYKKDDRIPFKMFLDNQVYDSYVRYLGKEQVKTKYGTFNAIKFRPLLVEGTIFTGGEKMTVWVSDDQNHVPLRIESPIIVGSIKVDMMTFRNLRYPLKSLRKLN